MATEVTLPKLGMNMESAKIVRWLKREGDSVASGDVLAEVETDKTTTELEAEASGVLRKLLVAEGQEIAVNQALAVIGAPDEDISPALARATAGHGEAHTLVKRVYQAWRAPAAVAARAPAAPDATERGATPGWQSASQDGATARGRGPRPAPGVPLSVSGGVGGIARRPAEHSGNGAPGPDPDVVRARLGLSRAQDGPVVAAPRRPKQRVVIYGAGLGAKQLLEVTRHLADVDVVGLIDDSAALAGTMIAGLEVVGGFSTLGQLLERGDVDAVALSFHSDVRRKVHRRLIAEFGARIIPLVDPRAIVGMDVRVGDGALIEAGAVVGPGTTVGEGAIVDVGAVVAHDCFLGPFSHLSPGCTLSGVVNLTENVLVGVGAAINSTVTIGRNVIIAPGAAVMNDLPDGVVVSGVPAKIIGQSRRGA